jgi:small-conductance mechanosensitive channel
MFWTSLFYLILKVILEEFAGGRVKDYKLRYTSRKVLSILFVLAVISVLITIWIENTQAIVVAYGLIAAGIAISLQDFFKGFAGGILILFNNLYRVGDRVQIGPTFGDVMDIGLFYTTLMETRGWVGGDQATGRIVMVSNAKVMSEDIFNYTKDHSFLWDEIKLHLTYDSNWQSLLEPILKMTSTEVAGMTEKASSEIERIGEKYYLPRKDVQPMVYVDFDSSWINLNVRFVSEARSRRIISNRLHRKILNEISRLKDVKVAQAQIESWKLGEGP